MNDFNATTDGKRFVRAPHPTGNAQVLTGDLLGVHLKRNEDVKWIWSHGPDGSRVTGYTIMLCQCMSSDAWKCAKNQNLTEQVACYCKCHRRK